MRAELKKLDYYVYGLREDDFHYMFDLAARFASSHVRASQEEIADLVARNQHELADDEVYYTFIDTLYLWEYLVWRFQGIFEGLITTVFLPASAQRRLPGLRMKLDEMKRSGYTLAADDEQDLMEWAELRNALSHAPPEGYRPVGLRQEDVAEYKSLLDRICKHWRAESLHILRNTQSQ